MINWILVELEVNKTKKFDVAVETTGWILSCNSNGPNINPPPIPNNPAIHPLINAYNGSLKYNLRSHFKSYSLKGKPISCRYAYSVFILRAAI